MAYELLRQEVIGLSVVINNQKEPHKNREIGFMADERMRKEEYKAKVI
ncbi:MAG: hypothetical protein IJ679_05490 [Lachnospiraceae bacterium]|nr:hypothetical protein [Lachnospiraceae bacterium]